MTDTTSNPKRFVELARSLGPTFAEHAAENDAKGRFVSDHYTLLKQHKFFSALVPVELGGGGARHAELCDTLRELGHYCGSTALALSMHTHLVAAAVYRFRHGQPSEALLRKVAASELVLVSTGAGDWVESIGNAERVAGGYRVTATKRFGSGSQAGDMLITSAPFEKEVLHFPVSIRAEGISIREDWDTLGMRASGSQSIELKNVFVPEESIALRRPRGQWHPSWNVIMTVAAPLYTAPYVGIAEQAAATARKLVAGRDPDAILLQSLGELENHLATAQMALREMMAITNEFDFEPIVEHANRTLIRKTIASNAAIATVNKAIECVGGSAYFRRLGLERMLRDVQAAPFHPLPEKKQLAFSGRVALGLSPIG